MVGLKRATYVKISSKMVNLRDKGWNTEEGEEEGEGEEEEEEEEGRKYAGCF